MNKGMTLVEVVIAAAILSVLLGGVMMTMMTGQDNFNYGSVVVHLESEATRILDWLTTQLPECRIVTAPSAFNNHITMTIQAPVNIGGEYWDAAGNIFWGADGNLDWTYTYSYSYEDNGPGDPSDGIYDEADDLQDYNGDSDMLDIFYIGKIQMIIRDALGVTQDTVDMGSNVLLAGATMDEDIDEDGSPDPLFFRMNSWGAEDFVNGNRIRVNLWLIKWENPEEEPITVHNSTERVLINPQ